MNGRYLQTIRRKSGCILAALLCLAGLLWAFTANAAAKQCWPSVGLRYNSGFSAVRRENARTYASEQTQAGEEAPMLTFWDEAQTELRANGRSLTATTVWVDGDAALAYPARCSAGGLPGAGDRYGCALSETAAWQLFSSADVVGLSVELAGRIYTVRGLFAGGYPLAVAGAADEMELSNIELSRSTLSDPRQAALDFVQAAGLGTPDQLCCGYSAAALAAAGCWLPAFLAAVWAMAALWHIVRMWQLLYRQLFIFAAMLVFALCLPALLGLLPGWVIPARWSDFSFWTDLAAVLAERGREWLALRPFAKDVEGKLALLQCAGGIAISCGGTLYLRSQVMSSHKRYVLRNKTEKST